MKNTQKSSFSPLLHLTYVLQQLSDENLLKATGVGLSSVRIMSVLHTAVPHSQRAVASLLQQTEANVSRQLRVMQKHGFVSVVKNKKDARQRDVKLTKKGEARYRAALKVLNIQEKELFRLLDSKRLKAFNEASGSLLSALNIIAATTRKL